MITQGVIGWNDVSDTKPPLAKGFNYLSIKVQVYTPLGTGSGYYNYADDDWLVELYSDESDELQAYKGVTFWRLFQY